MSFRYLTISCSKCDFSDSDIGMYGLFSYQSPRGLVPITRQLGWCHDCQGTEPIEILPSQKRLRDIEEQEYHGLWSCLPGTEPLSEDEKAKELESIRISREYDLKEEMLRLSILADRKSPPRCLTCGSKDVFALNPDTDRPSHWYDSTTPSPIDVTHPVCRGELLVACSDSYMSFFIDDRVYDLEGLAILP